MTNRQDRRFAAKLARQTLKRGRTPAERALFAAAAAFLADEPMEVDAALDGFDAAWTRLDPDLREILEGGTDAFRRDVFAEVAWAPILVDAPDGTERIFDLQPILLPASGSGAAIASFVGDPETLAALAASLHASGVFPEDASLAILPVLVRPEAVDLASVGPAAVSRLVAALAEGGEGASPDGEDALAWMHAAVSGADLPLVETGAEFLSGLLLGFCLTPADEAEMSDEEVEARHLAMAATRASWLDTYAADLPFRLDEPVFWHEAGSSLAWHGVAGAIEAEIARLGEGGAVSRIDACLAPPSGDPVLVARVGETWLGPFHAPASLVWTDVDGFAGLAEQFAGELVEHERPGDVLRRIGTTPAG